MEFRKMQSGVASLLTVLGLMFGLASLPAQAGELTSLENLERERAILLAAVRDLDLSVTERADQVDAAKRRLIDLERIVVRDDNLTGHTAPLVRQAFANYDLTFLVNASAQQRSTIAEHWLSQLGLTSAALKATVKGRR